MKKLVALLIMVIAGYVAVANNGNEKPKPVISNYADVLSQIEYPTVCRDKGIEGTVLVKISVDRKGEMKSFKIVDSPCSDLKKAVADAIPSLNFLAPVVDGRSVSSKIVVPVKFKLTY